MEKALNSIAIQGLIYLSTIGARELNGGSDGSRTHGLLIANEALSQLSYRPENL